MSIRLEHVAIGVRDVERSKKLYCDLVGYEQVSETLLEAPDARRLVFLQKGPDRIELIEMRGDTWAPAAKGRVEGLAHICFVVPDLKTETRRWEAAGVTVLIPYQRTAVAVKGQKIWGRAVFEGPDGEQIELRGT